MMLRRCVVQRTGTWRMLEVRRLSGAAEGLVLPDRRLIAVDGAEKEKFLQGMVTNDVMKLSAAGGVEKAVFTNFLNAKGRFRFDAFVASLTADSRVSPSFKESIGLVEDSAFLIDTSSDQVDQLTRYLKMRTLGARVKVHPVPESTLRVVQYLPKASAPVKIDSEDHASALIFHDPRSDRMGVRSMSVVESMPQSGRGDSDGLPTYRRHRILCGIAEGPQEMEVEKTVPLEASLHYFNAICFTKGCYVGQELMARVHFTGTIRKQAIPLLLSSSPVESTHWTTFETARLRVAQHQATPTVTAGDTVSFVKSGGEKGRRVGKVMACEGGVALVMMRFQCLEDSAAAEGEGAISGTLCIESESGDTIAASHVVRPHWWAERPVER